MAHHQRRLSQPEARTTGIQSRSRACYRGPSPSGRYHVSHTTRAVVRNRRDRQMSYSSIEARAPAPPTAAASSVAGNGQDRIGIFLLNEGKGPEHARYVVERLVQSTGEEYRANRQSVP